MSRIFAGILLLATGLVGLFMTTCGGYFTGLPFFKDSKGGEVYVWIFSIPSTLMGVWLLFNFRRQLREWRGAPYEP
jgi:hypothetical protein